MIVIAWNLAFVRLDHARSLNTPVGRLRVPKAIMGAGKAPVSQKRNDTSRLPASALHPSALVRALDLRIACLTTLENAGTPRPLEWHALSKAQHSRSRLLKIPSRPIELVRDIPYP